MMTLPPPPQYFDSSIINTGKNLPFIKRTFQRTHRHPDPYARNIPIYRNNQDLYCKLYVAISPRNMTCI